MAGASLSSGTNCRRPAFLSREGCLPGPTASRRSASEPAATTSRALTGGIGPRRSRKPFQAVRRRSGGRKGHTRDRPRAANVIGCECTLFGLDESRDQRSRLADPVPVTQMDLRKSFDEALVCANDWFGSVTAPWFVYQVAIIVALFLMAKFLAQRIEPVLEVRARGIKGHPGLLRVVVALLRRTDWIIYAVLLLAALIFMRSVTWPSRSYLISIALSLSL